jgi:hypothetical protein
MWWTTTEEAGVRQRRQMTRARSMLRWRMLRVQMQRTPKQARMRRRCTRGGAKMRRRRRRMARRRLRSCRWVRAGSPTWLTKGATKLTLTASITTSLVSERILFTAAVPCGNLYQQH